MDTQRLMLVYLLTVLVVAPRLYNKSVAMTHIQGGRGTAMDRLRLVLVYLLTAEALPSEEELRPIQSALGDRPCTLADGISLQPRNSLCAIMHEQ